MYINNPVISGDLLLLVRITEAALQVHCTLCVVVVLEEDLPVLLDSGGFVTHLMAVVLRFNVL